MPQQQTFADTPLTPDQVKAAGYTDAPLSSAHPWTEDYPKTAAVARSVVNALPGAGGVVGAAIAGPETAGLAAVPAAALGVGVGRGLRDLIAEGLGLDKKSSPLAKGGRIALDTTEAAAAQAILPGVWEAIRTPGKTIGEIIDMLPARLRPTLPQAAAKAPAALLQRPAWQTWSEHVDLPAATPAPVTALSGQTGTSMMPGAPIRPVPAASVPAAAAPVAPASAPAAASATATASTLARNLKLTAEETKQVYGFLQRGATLPQAVEKIQTMRELRASGSFAGLPTTADVKAAVADRNVSGRWDEQP